MRNLLCVFFLSVMTTFSLICADVSMAQVTLPWSTTFNCPEWTCCGPLTCDGMVIHGGWSTAGGTYEQITSAANNPVGGGGRGQRHWLGDSHNNNSGGLRVDFNTPVSEFWVRWYIRFQPGFAWSNPNYYKIIYVNVGNRPYCEIDWPRGWDGTGILPNMAKYFDGPAGSGWDSLMVNGPLVNGHRTSDGQWHCFEMHLKTDTNRANGIWQVWLDGVLKVNLNNIDYMGSLFYRVLFGSNHTVAANGKDAYVDYDDIAINSTGYIGPPGNPTPPPSPPTNPTPPPSPPTNLRIIPYQSE